MLELYPILSLQSARLETSILMHHFLQPWLKWR